MNEKELIELAAKAAGIECVVIEFGTLGVFKGCKSDEDFTVIFNPLHDDGDAMRLAVKMSLDVHSCNEAEHTYVTSGDSPTSVYTKEHHRRDKYAATRRAIVRAAAEIGRNM